MKTATIKSGKAFSCDADNQGYKARVEEDGTVLVWDSAAKCYVPNHILTPAQMAYVRRVAR